MKVQNVNDKKLQFNILVHFHTHYTLKHIQRKTIKNTNPLQSRIAQRGYIMIIIWCF